MTADWILFGTLFGIGLFMCAVEIISWFINGD